MQIVTIDGCNASCAAKGMMREVGLFMLQDEPVAVDDFVMVPVGYALQKMTEQEACLKKDLIIEKRRTFLSLILFSQDIKQTNPHLKS